MKLAVVIACICSFIWTSLGKVYSTEDLKSDLVIKGLKLYLDRENDDFIRHGLIRDDSNTLPDFNRYVDRLDIL